MHTHTHAHTHIHTCSHTHTHTHAYTHTHTYAYTHVHTCARPQTRTENKLIKLPANKYTVREREMLIGSGILPKEFFEAARNPFVIGLGGCEWHLIPAIMLHVVYCTAPFKPLLR